MEYLYHTGDYGFIQSGGVMPGTPEKQKSKRQVFVYHTQLMLDLAWNDFRKKYAGSVFGVFWALAQPLVTVVIYWFVFQVALGSGPVDGFPFVLWLVAGLVPWMFFQEAMSYGGEALLGYSYLVKKVSFDISILPVMKVISALFVHLMTLGIMLVLYTAMGYFPGLQILQVLYYSACTFVLAVGFAYADAAIIVFFRDLGHMINIALQVGTWVTPILWNLSRFPAKYQLIFKINPMNYVVQGYREALLYKKFFWEEPVYTLYFWGVTMLLLLIGRGIFKKLKPHFADVL